MMFRSLHSGCSRLKIAFFGSDAFSVVSLARLNALKAGNPALISQLDVITRSIKPTGRNLKTLVDVPVGLYAGTHGLPIYRADSGNDILALKSLYDLVVAVSYGRLIPGEFLAKARYGGINVHPSLLPQYSGSSPIQYALMEDAEKTGVTVQTLHPTKFDHGSIIVQSEPVEIANNDDFSLLLARLAGVGADLLENVVVSGKFVDPQPVESTYHYSLASKIIPGKREVDWHRMTSRQIRRLYDALGPLHTHKRVDVVKKKKRVNDLYKVILEDIHESFGSDHGPLAEPGDFTLADGKLLVKTSDGAVSVGRLKLQYCGSEDAETFTKQLSKRAGDTPYRFESAQDTSKASPGSAC